MTDAERKLLESTARALLQLTQYMHEEFVGLQSVLRALYLSDGNSRLAIARLRVERDLRRLQGRHAAYLTKFIEELEELNHPP